MSRLPGRPWLSYASGFALRPEAFALLAVAATLSVARVAAAQGSASQRLDRAFAQLTPHHVDSAAMLLQPILDSTLRATPVERGTAWFLRGIIDFYRDQNGDSVAAEDFRMALARTLTLRGDWLARVDSTLGATWRRERGRAICDSAARDSRDTLAAGDDVQVVDERPKILSGPPPPYPYHLRQAGVGGRVLLAGVIDTGGRVEPGSIKVIASSHKDLTREARYYLERAVFQPGLIGGRPVRTCVELPVEFRITQVVR